MPSDNLKDLNLTNLLPQSEQFLDLSFETQSLLKLNNDNNINNNVEEIDELYDSVFGIKTIKLKLSKDDNNNSIKFFKQKSRNNIFL